MNRNEKGQFVGGTIRKDLTGQRYGMLMVVEVDRIVNKRSYWKCKCDCGNEKTIRGDTLKIVRSCGCLKKKQDIINFGIIYNHGMTYHPAFDSWSHMMRRCYAEQDEAYNNYGGRGISVCEEWWDVVNFCKWADESGHEKGLTIERIDVNGDYCPENCCWIPKNEQAYNRRNMIRIIYNGEERILALVIKELGLDFGKVKSRWAMGIRDNERLLYPGDLRDLRRKKRSEYENKMESR